MTRKKQGRKLAKLTPEENHDWEYFFSWHLNNGSTEAEADRNAWRDLQQKHPRLKEYQGCKP
jgi:hypothetical protein